MQRLIQDTERLRLTAMTHQALDAWVEADGAALESRTGVRFPESVAPPPLFEEDLPGFRDRMYENPRELGWWVWLVSRRDDGRAVGVCGLGGRPSRGSATLGYSVYPTQEGQGFATEAASALVAWVFQHSDAERVRARVPIGNPRSRAVAERLGMVFVARDSDPDVGEVAVYEIGRAVSDSSASDA